MSIEVRNNYNPSGDVGVEYAVTNAKGVTHILMGTCHYIDAETLRNLCLDRILKCSELFMEVGTMQPLNHMDGCFPGVIKYTIPYPHCVDDFLTIMAGWRKIPITSLDAQVPELQDIMAKINAQCKEWGAVVYGNAKAYQRYKRQKSASLYNRLEGRLTTYCYKKGYTSFVEGIRSSKGFKDTQYQRREDKWCEILIPKLLESDKSIGIAVGMLHVCGKNSLSERFAKSGMKVEQITPKRRSRL
jgi:hypothetical protein